MACTVQTAWAKGAKDRRLVARIKNLTLTHLILLKVGKVVKSPSKTLWSTLSRDRLAYFVRGIHVTNRGLEVGDLLRHEIELPVKILRIG